MGALRLFLHDHRRLAAVLLAAVLCLKAVMPAGYMVSTQDRVLTVTVCAESTGQQIQHQIIIPGKPAAPAPQDMAQGKCAFAPLGMEGIAGGDPVLLLLAAAFAIALGFAPIPLLRLRRADHLRPPLRGPPLAA